eukprot:Ihof_evm3s757 gene=Ihof_evmTU3s757
MDSESTPRPNLPPSSASHPPRSSHLAALGSFATEDLIAILAPLLEQLMAKNDKLPLTELTSFHARTCPPISIHSYLL